MDNRDRIIKEKRKELRNHVGKSGFNSLCDKCNRIKSELQALEQVKEPEQTSTPYPVLCDICQRYVDMGKIKVDQQQEKKPDQQCEKRGQYETCINPHEIYYRGCTELCKYYKSAPIDQQPDGDYDVHVPFVTKKGKKYRLIPIDQQPSKSDLEAFDKSMFSFQDQSDNDDEFVKSYGIQPDLHINTPFYDNSGAKIPEQKLFILDLLKLNKSIKIDDEKYYPESSVINIIKQVLFTGKRCVMPDLEKFAKLERDKLSCF